MKIGIPLLALIAAGLLADAPTAVARGPGGASGGAFASPHAAFAHPQPAGHVRAVFAGNRRTIVVRQHFALAPIPPQRRFIPHRRILVERPILVPAPVFTAPVLVIIVPTCCG